MISYDIPIKIPFGKYFFFHRLFLKELVYCGFTRLTRSPILNRIVEIVPISCCCMTDIELSQENSSDIPIPFDPTRLPSMFTLSLIFFLLEYDNIIEIVRVILPRAPCCIPLLFPRIYNGVVCNIRSYRFWMTDWLTCFFIYTIARYFTKPVGYNVNPFLIQEIRTHASAFPWHGIQPMGLTDNN